MFTKKVISRMIKGPILHIFGSKIILLFVKILSYMILQKKKKCAVDVMTWVVNKKVISRCQRSNFTHFWIKNKYVVQRSKELIDILTSKNDVKNMLRSYNSYAKKERNKLILKLPKQQLRHVIFWIFQIILFSL